jgi:hypothetical protein
MHSLTHASIRSLSHSFMHSIGTTQRRWAPPHRDDTPRERYGEDCMAPQGTDARPQRKDAPPRERCRRAIHGAPAKDDTRPSRRCFAPGGCAFTISTSCMQTMCIVVHAHPFHRGECRMLPQKREPSGDAAADTQDAGACEICCGISCVRHPPAPVHLAK